MINQKKGTYAGLIADVVLVMVSGAILTLLAYYMGFVQLNTNLSAQVSESSTQYVAHTYTSAAISNEKLKSKLRNLSVSPKCGPGLTYEDFNKKLPSNRFTNNIPNLENVSFENYYGWDSKKIDISRNKVKASKLLKYNISGPYKAVYIKFSLHQKTGSNPVRILFGKDQKIVVAGRVIESVRNPNRMELNKNPLIIEDYDDASGKTSYTKEALNIKSNKYRLIFDRTEGKIILQALKSDGSVEKSVKLGNLRKTWQTSNTHFIDVDKVEAIALDPPALRDNAGITVHDVKVKTRAPKCYKINKKAIEKAKQLFIGDKIGYFSFENENGVKVFKASKNMDNYKRYSSSWIATPTETKYKIVTAVGKR